MKQNVITVSGVTVKPGERRYIDLPLPSLYTHSRVMMPIHVIHGRRPGPKLFVSAAIHGDEINGIEIIRRLLHYKALKTLKGTLIAVPVVNVYGFLNKTRYLPDRRDLNRSFPGHERGSLAARIAHLFVEEVVSHCTHGIDLHTAAIGRTNLPQVRATLNGNDELRKMACVFRSPVILDTETRAGTLRSAAQEYGIPTLLYEAGEALRFDEIPIRAGVKGILAVMRDLGMLPASKIRHPNYKPLISKRSKWVRAPQSGIFRSITPMGKFLHEGDILGYVGDPFGTSEEIIHAPLSGILVGRSTLPLVHEGEALFHIAETDVNHKTGFNLRDFHHEIDPDQENPFR
ncbi:MAG: succinylglutamate desuccinylase/aspartoacylase family protein [Thiolinea sp.]